MLPKQSRQRKVCTKDVIGLSLILESIYFFISTLLHIKYFMLCIDPNTPKGPRSAWHFFTSSRKQQALAEQPHGTAFKIMSHLAGEYKALSEEDRNVFDEMAKQDKRRYNAEMGMC